MMTINEAIQNIEIVKEDYWEDDGYGNETRDYQDTMFSFDLLIDIARKYQKIEQILDAWENNGEEDDPMNIIDSIEEVLEDRNNN